MHATGIPICLIVAYTKIYEYIGIHDISYMTYIRKHSYSLDPIYA
jgi:hypothetical protein